MGATTTAKTTLITDTDETSAGAPATWASRLRAAKLDPFDSHQVFRTLLDTLSQPGTIGHLPALEVPAAVIPLLALADLETTVAVQPVPGALDGTDLRWVDVVVAATGCRPAEWGEADLAVALGPPPAGAVLRLRRGTPVAPEQAARLCLSARSLRIPAAGQAPAPTGALTLKLWGPGVASVAMVQIEGIEAAVFAELRHANAAFPAGIDAHVVADDGAIVSLPRTTRFDVIEAR